MRYIISKLSYPLVICCLLASMFLPACATQSISAEQVMTVEEQVYWQQFKAWIDEGNVIADSFNERCDGQATRDAMESALNCQSAAEDTVRESTKLLVDIRSYGPVPPLFEHVHKQNEAFWESVSNMWIRTVELGELCSEMYSNCVEDGRILEKETMSMLNTIVIASDKAIDDVYIILEERLEDGHLGQNLRDQVVMLSYQPIGIPLKVTINHLGEISFTCEGSLPTPIGVFSIGTEIKYVDVRVLKIIYNDTVMLYDMGDEQYTIELNVEGAVVVFYDGDGNVVITID